MAKRKTNQSESVRQYMKEHPDASAIDIAKAVKVQPGLVYSVKASLKAKSGKKATKKTTRGGVVIAGSNGTADQIVAAARLIQSCGGVNEAKQALKAATQVAAALEQ